jgi:predicted nucleic acid-binding protein
MTLVLDAGAVMALTTKPALLIEFRRRQLWPPQVPTAVLVESLTGDHRRDFQANRLLRACQIRDVDEIVAREAARLRTATGRAGAVSAVDAIVVAFAATRSEPVILTCDPKDISALAAQSPRGVSVAVL